MPSTWCLPVEAGPGLDDHRSACRPRTVAGSVSAWRGRNRNAWETSVGYPTAAVPPVLVWGTRGSGRRCPTGDGMLPTRPTRTGHRESTRRASGTGPPGRAPVASGCRHHGAPSRPGSRTHRRCTGPVGAAPAGASGVVEQRVGPPQASRAFRVSGRRFLGLAGVPRTGRSRGDPGRLQRLDPSPAGAGRCSAWTRITVLATIGGCEQPVERPRLAWVAALPRRPRLPDRIGYPTVLFVPGRQDLLRCRPIWRGVRVGGSV